MRKKDTLYKANKWNKPLFMPEPEDENLFYGMQPGTSRMDNILSTSGLGANGSSFNAFANAGTSHPEARFGTSTGITGSTRAGMVGGAASAAGGKGGGFSAGGGAAWAAAAPGIGLGWTAALQKDPQYSTDAYNGFSLVDSTLTGGKKSQVGMGLVNSGAAVMNKGLESGNGGMALVGGIAGTLGTIINNGWGYKVNQARLEAAERGIKANERFVSNASNFDDIVGPAAQATNSNVYKGGVFTSGKAARKNRELAKRIQEARDHAYRSVENNIDNLISDQLNDALANYSAFGGPIEVMPMFNGNNRNMGAIEYGMMTDFLATKQKNAENKNQMTNMFMGSPSTMFDLGGDIQMNGGDFSTGLTHIDAGGSHSENPNDGVQMGVDREGTPNLVEEGETVFDDYVFSNRILADDATKKLFHLPKKKDITFADISKKLEKEISERPNDPISEAGFKAQMQTLEEQQERQKQEMEAERAKAAFEALSPEEQTAVMQRLAQEEAMAQQAEAQAQAQQQAQPSPEEQAIMQQQMMQADGSQAMVGQEPPMMAEGGHLFPWGGIKEMFAVKPPYAASRTAGFIPYTRDLTEEEVLKREEDPTFQAWTQYVNDNWDSEEVQNYLKDLDAAAGGNHLFDKDGKLLPKAKDYFNHARKGNHKWGYYHLTPTQLAEEAAKEAAIEKAAEVNPRVFHALEGDDDYIQGELSPEIGPETRRVTLDNGDTVIYHDKKPLTEKTPSEVAAATGDTDQSKKKVGPNYKPDWMRYAGLFGPAVGLGMQMAGIGRPDYSDLNAAVDSAGDVSLASYKPLGDYLKFRPMDIWFEQNRMDANARATDRAIMNNASPIGTKMAGLLASGYNNQIADGELYRKALEYNDALRERVAQFNRGTNQFNADAFNQTSRFNASARNEAAGRNLNARLHAAQTKLENDAGWYNSLYGNVSGLFKGLSDLGRENAQHNKIAQMWADGLAGTATPDTYTASDYLKWQKRAAKGGDIKRKKGKRRGLTI